jgi:hypothetical protein
VIIAAHRQVPHRTQRRLGYPGPTLLQSRVLTNFADVPQANELGQSPFLGNVGCYEALSSFGLVMDIAFQIAHVVPTTTVPITSAVSNLDLV